MKAIEIKPNIYWVGAKDWNLNIFHGYKTQRGSTYNAYLLVDEKIVLVDTVKESRFDEMLTRIKSVVDPSKIDYIICNHVEMDHSGSLPKMAKIAPNAKILASPKGEKGLNEHFRGHNLSIDTLKSGEKLNIGKRNLQFLHMPMVHWPDSMASYLIEEKLLFSNDAFGQHYCMDTIFDDECPKDILFHEAGKYYANIVYPYGRQVEKVLDAIKELPIEMIATSHGVIWRKHIEEIIASYKKWATNGNDNKALIIYDTMWGSTEKMVYAVQSGFEEKNIPVTIRCLSCRHYSDVITDVLESKYIAIGTPTLNNEILPTISSFLTYMKGLKPKNKIGFAFASYGWAPKVLKPIVEVMEELKWEILADPQYQKYVPSGEECLKLKNLVANAVV